MTDFRALCANLTIALNDWQYESGDDRYADLIERARAALAEQPVEPKDFVSFPILLGDGICRPLSPAAQVVLDAVVSHPEYATRKRIAAALRATADQVVPEQAEPVGDSHDEARHDQWMRIRYRFLAIAAELEAQ